MPIINVDGGDILRGAKGTEKNFDTFGEMYFSEIQFNYIKGWKVHTKMTCNLLVPVGSVKFVATLDKIKFQEFILGRQNYRRLTIPPNWWFAFKGLSEGTSTVCNVANLTHDPDEAQTLPLNKIPYSW